MKSKKKNGRHNRKFLYNAQIYYIKIENSKNCCADNIWSFRIVSACVFVNSIFNFWTYKSNRFRVIKKCLNGKKLRALRCVSIYYDWRAIVSFSNIRVLKYYLSGVKCPAREEKVHNGITRERVANESEMNGKVTLSLVWGTVLLLDKVRAKCMRVYMCANIAVKTHKKCRLIK